MGEVRIIPRKKGIVFLLSTAYLHSICGWESAMWKHCLPLLSIPIQDEVLDCVLCWNPNPAWKILQVSDHLAAHREVLTSQNSSDRKQEPGATWMHLIGLVKLSWTGRKILWESIIWGGFSLSSFFVLFSLSIPFKQSKLSQVPVYQKHG